MGRFKVKEKKMRKECLEELAEALDSVGWNLFALKQTYSDETGHTHLLIELSPKDFKKDHPE
jgi:hypothetical protein